MKKPPVIIFFSLLVITSMLFVACDSNVLKPQVYKVSFSTDGGSIVRTQRIEEGAKVTKPNNPTKFGYRFVFWTKDGTNEFNFNQSVYSNLSLKAIWTSVNIYTVTFDSKGGSAVESEKVMEGDYATKPEDPTYTNYKFDGWYNGDNPFDFNTAITSDITLIAHWKDIPTYTVTFKNEDEVYETKLVKEGDKVTEPTDPTKEGLHFVSWNKEDDGTVFDFENETITSDITLFATWSVDANYMVTFNSDGGSAVAPQIITTGKTASKPDNPTKDGFVFVDWYKEDDTVFNFNTAITSDITLKAKWNELFTVTFDSIGGSDVPSQIVENGKTVAKPNDPTKTGYAFKFWSTDGSTEFNFDTTINANTTLKAVWEALSKFTVTFKVDDNVYQTQSVFSGDKVKQPDDPDAEVGKHFKCWNKEDGNIFDFANETIESDITLVAAWDTVLTHTVFFNADGGSTVNPQIVEDGKTATDPKPTKAGYKLECWVNEEDIRYEAFNFNTPITEDVYLIAKWTPYTQTYKVTFDSKTGSYVADQEIVAGKMATKPADPTRVGFIFAYWYKTDENVEFNFDLETINEDTTLNARWYQKSKVYNVTFDYGYQGGHTYQEVYEGNKVKKIDDPIREGYQFITWLKDDGTVFNFDTEIVTSSFTLKALWKTTPVYKISFDTTGGSSVATITVYAGDYATKPADPICDDKYHTFNYWTIDGSSEFKFDSVRITKDITLKALWRDYCVGDIGPSGGYIFYDVDADNLDGNKDGLKSSECGWRYLEAAKKDLDGKYVWSSGNGKYNTSTGLGKGKANTKYVYEREEATSFATDVWGKTIDGYSDWFVPSRDEIKLMYENLYKKGKGNFSTDDDGYWSSSEVSNVSAYQQKFSNDDTATCFKDFKKYIRPVRSF